MKKEDFKNDLYGSVLNRVKIALMLVVFIGGLSGLNSSLLGQTVKEQAGKEPVYEKVDKMPLFNGKDAGEFALWIGKQIKYPEEALKKKIIGNVTVSFIVEKDGTVSNVKVVKGVPELDGEAVRVVKSSPKWTPGVKDNSPVRVSFIIPINFKTDFPSDAKLKKT
jgi:TonB family protein